MIRGLTLNQASSLIGCHKNTLHLWEKDVTKVPEYAKDRILKVYNLKEGDIKWDLD
jgi:hypothetical protein